MLIANVTNITNITKKKKTKKQNKKQATTYPPCLWSSHLLALELFKEKGKDGSVTLWDQLWALLQGGSDDNAFFVFGPFG